MNPLVSYAILISVEEKVIWLYLEILNKSLTKFNTHYDQNIQENRTWGTWEILNMVASVSVQFSHSVVSASETLWIAAWQASLSIINSRGLLKLMSIESVMPSNHLILCHPLLPPSIFPSIRIFSNKSALPIRWPNYWSFSLNINLSKEHSGLISFRID